MKKILLLIAVLLVAGGAWYWFGMRGDMNQNSDNTRLADPNFPQPEQQLPRLEAKKFVGVLEEVNTGCFADGECYAMIGGAHVTLLTGDRLGGSQLVGQVYGVPTIGDLEKAIGKEFEVYAQEKADGTFTLYGNDTFYVRLK